MAGGNYSALLPAPKIAPHAEAPLAGDELPRLLTLDRMADCDAAFGHGAQTPISLVYDLWLLIRGHLSASVFQITLSNPPACP